MQSIAQTDPVDNPTPDRAAVKAAAESLQAFHPEVDPKRLTVAMDLVLRRAVQRTRDGAVVTSGGQRYHVAPDCACPDATHRSRWCKHKLAVALFDRACPRPPLPFRPLTSSGGDVPRDQREPEPAPAAAPADALAQLARAPVTPHRPPLPAPAPAACSEARASCTLKWQDGGVELLLTLRDQDDATLFERLKPILAKVKATVAAERDHRQAAADAAQASGQPVDPSWCTIHATGMTRKEKHGEVWWSHKAPDGSWCKGGAA